MESDLTKNKSAYAALRRSLNAEMGLEASGTAEGLCVEADTLIRNFGKDGTINHLPAWVSAGYVQRDDLADRRLYVRLAKLKNPGDGDELPFIVFGETPSLRTNTVKMRALRFQEFAGDVSLRIDEGVEPLLNDPEYLTLAAELIKGIAGHSAAVVEQEQSAKEARRQRVARVGQAIRAYFNDKGHTPRYSSFETVGDRRKFILGAWTVVCALSYSHLAFGSADAKIGPVALPLPIELFVDLDNMADHRAQGFGEPEMAVALRIGDKGVRLPLFDEYDAEGAPDATQMHGVAPNYSFTEESKPGLYKVNYPSAAKLTGTAEGEPKPPHCFKVLGNYRNGNTKVFTQDAATAEEVYISVKDANELEACVVNDKSGSLGGSFYIWQKP